MDVVGSSQALGSPHTWQQTSWGVGPSPTHADAHVVAVVCVHVVLVEVTDADEKVEPVVVVDDVMVVSVSDAFGRNWSSTGSAEDQVSATLVE
mmetsp:Transcript_65952/g.189780  ORF Transcript_65952/g.189780 Transcript_65952/m.189780 type:complete len:93 (-) Transcript_65952:344-622(-)